MNKKGDIIMSTMHTHRFDDDSVLHFEITQNYGEKVKVDRIPKREFDSLEDAVEAITEWCEED